MPRAAALLCLSSLLLQSGCFWGEADATLFFSVSEDNAPFYEGLLYPSERESAWSDIFADRSATLCVDADDPDDCDPEDGERSDLIEYSMPYETTKVRGLQTQKGDLQITAHLSPKDIYSGLADDAFSRWGYYEDSSLVYGRAGGGCGPELSPYERTGLGPCLLEEVRDNAAAYGSLDEDLSVVLLINLPGLDDVRSVGCQERPESFSSSDWEYPRTLRVNYNARRPELDEGTGTEKPFYGSESQPLAQCDIEVYSRVQLGIEVFSADYYGEDEEDLPDDEREATLDLRNGPDETMLGTVEIESLTLPDEDGEARVSGRFRIAYTSNRFSTRDGTVEVAGTFDTEIRKDTEQVDEPEREVDLVGGVDAQ